MNVKRLMVSASGEDTFLKKLLSNKAAIAGLVILLSLVVIALLASFLSPYAPTALVAEPYLPPSYSHPFGTDGLGRDIFSQMIHGTALSLEIGFVSAAGITILGTTVGIISGYFGSYVDEALMRVVDVLLVIPSIAFMIFVAVILGPGLESVLIVIIVFGWPPMARMIRSQTLTLREREFVESAVVSGAPKWYILGSMIFPNVISLIIANGILAVIYGVIADASLAFLGLASTKNYSWGTVLYNAQNEGAVFHGGIAWILAPGIFIALTGIAITLIARAIDDIMDPRYSAVGR